MGIEEEIVAIGVKLDLLLAESGGQKQVLNQREAAELLGLSVQTVLKLDREGWFTRLPAFEKPRYSREHLLAFARGEAREGVSGA